MIYKMPLVQLLTIIRKDRTMSYGDKRNYTKIDIYYDGKYVGSTTWSKTLKEAKTRYYTTNWKQSLVAQRIKCKFDRKVK